MRRREHRQPIAVAAVYRAGIERRNISLWDISCNGCRIFVSGLTMRQGQRVVLKPEGMEAMDGTIRWAGDEFAGVQFDRPLHPAVVDHLCRLHPDESRVSFELAA
jgi:PilZ domain